MSAYLDNSETSNLLASILRWLESSKIRYCVERNYDNYPQIITGDVDLVVEGKDIEDATIHIRQLAECEGWYCYYVDIRPLSAYIGLAKSIYPARFALTIELFDGARWHGLPYLTAKEILNNREKHGVTWRPSNTHQAIITSMHHLLYNKHVPVKYHKEVIELIRKDSNDFKITMRKSFGRNLAKYAYNKITEQNWEKLATKYFLYQLKMIMGGLLHPVANFPVLIEGYIATTRIDEGVAIVVSDTNPARKHTLCDALLELADRWHLFLPPSRKKYEYPIDKRGQRGYPGWNHVLSHGGIAIFVSNSTIVHKIYTEYPQYFVENVDRGYKLVATDGHNDILDEIFITDDNIEAAVGQIWNFILQNRANSKLRNDGIKN